MPDKLALVGDEDTILGFGALGMDTFVAERKTEAQAVLKEIQKKSYAVIFITHEAAEFLEEELETSMKERLVMIIPSCRSRKSMGLEEIASIVEKAVGIADIMDKAK